MNWTWFHKLGSPKWFYEISSRWLPWLVILTILLLVTGVVWGLAFAPAERFQGNSYRIIFIHVPAAFLAQATYVLMAITGGVGLIWRMKMAELVASCCAPIGASFTLLALLTGAIWGKPTWGAWWVWDARLTSMLILLFLYLGFMALQASIDNMKTAARASAVLALVGLVNIPIIKYSVDWWFTLHQTASIKLTEKPAMPAEMYYPLFICLAGFYCFFTVVLLLRLRTEILHREHKTGWVKALMSNKR